MPRKVDYPRSSFSKSLDLADAVDRLGGHATEDTLAAEMKMSLGGGFRAIVAAALKFGLISRAEMRIESTDLAADIRLAYDEAERETHLQSAFLGMPLFADLHNRFLGKKLPMDILEKLLQKEFQVNRTIASRVGKYFADGAVMSGLLNRDTLDILPRREADVEAREANELPSVGNRASVAATPSALDTSPTQVAESNSAQPLFSVTSPSLSTTIALTSKSDFLLARAILDRLEDYLNDAE